MKSATLHRMFGVAALLVAFCSITTAAYELPLSPESIREAYFLGRHGDQADAFLVGYMQSPLALLDHVADVEQIELLTPYAQIVNASRFGLANQNAVDVDQIYANKSLPLLIDVWIFFPEGYSGPFNRFSRLVRQCTISVSQSAVLKPLATSYKTLYTSGKARWPDGIEVEMSFQAEQFRAAPVHITISSPNAGHSDSVFNLADLK